MMQWATLIAATGGTVLIVVMTRQRVVSRIVNNDAFAVECVKSVSVKQRRNSNHLDQHE
jgi:hypothetical protein